VQPQHLGRIWQIELSKSCLPSGRKVGLVRVELTTSCLRGRCNCLSASTPCTSYLQVSPHWRPGNRTRRDVLIRLVRSTRPSSPSSLCRCHGSGAIRTLINSLKRRVCYPLTPRSRLWFRVCVWFRDASRRLLAPFLRKFSGSPANRTQRRGLIRAAWATSPRLPRTNSVGRLGVEPRTSCSQGTRASICTSARWRFTVSSPCGSRTQPDRLEKPLTSPEVERAASYLLVICLCRCDVPVRRCVRAPCAHEWAGRRSNPRLRFFRPPLDRLSYQPEMGSPNPLGECADARGHEKRPGVA
jgi:hypothetical protein